MKNKELLLDRDPKRSPVGFIFSHSALREGWDNPNVFQICTLKQSGSDIRKRQEVDRGLRLCVNQDGERQDANALGNDVHNVNILTVIASESYDSFAKGLQSEIAENVADRPRTITADLFVGKVINDLDGHEQVVDRDTAYAIMYDLTINRYIDKKGVLTDKYYEDKFNGILQIAEEVNNFAASIVELIDSVYNPRAVQPENARGNKLVRMLLLFCVVSKRLFLISLKIILKSSLSRQLHSLMRKRQQPLSSTLFMPFWISITV